MRTVIAQIYDYSLDGIIPEEGMSFFDFCRELPEDPAQVDRTGEGTRLFSELPQPTALEFVAATPASSGIPELTFRRINSTTA